MFCLLFEVNCKSYNAVATRLGWATWITVSCPGKLLRFCTKVFVAPACVASSYSSRLSLLSCLHWYFSNKTKFLNNSIQRNNCFWFCFTYLKYQLMLGHKPKNPIVSTDVCFLAAEFERFVLLNLLAHTDSW